jgi:hypothetical protein
MFEYVRDLAQTEVAERRKRRRQDKASEQPLDTDLAQDALWNEGAERDAAKAQKEGVAVLMDDSGGRLRRRRKVSVTDEQLRMKERQVMRASKLAAGSK